jgi:sigma-B regulation protein RsbU (phosphoserine phosphatase)
VVEAQIHDMPLGLLPTWEGLPEEWPLEPEDVLLLYSDGLVEVRNAEGELFDSFRAARVLAQNAESSAEAIVEALVQAANDWGPLTDDLTVVVCKRVTDTPSE